MIKETPGHLLKTLLLSKHGATCTCHAPSVVASFPACENDFDISHAISELSREEGQRAERRPRHFSELLRISCCSVCISLFCFESPNSSPNPIDLISINQLCLD